MSNLSAPHFHNEEAAYAFVEARLGPNGAVCPHCGETKRLGKMGGKTHDVSACIACSACHTWLDQYHGTEEERLFYTRRAMVETWLYWISIKLVGIK